MNDFYLGFYMCHMSKRVIVAIPDSSTARLIAHLIIFAPVSMMILFALPQTTRKLSLLYGVLHLQEDAVCEVTKFCASFE